MPTFRSINLELRSQYDLDPIIEFLPPTSPPKVAPQGLDTYLAMREIKKLDEKTATCSRYIPVFPSSQFWIAYSIDPPIPPAAYFLFKLFINGIHVVSWGCGPKDGYKGKTMFGLYERPEQEGANGRKRIEKRAMFFGGKDDKGKEVQWDMNDPSAMMEVRVHRAKGRRRIARKFEQFGKTFHASHARGIELVNAGLAKGESPKRFYEFALIDPVDQPFATFKYYYRTLDQLDQLGVTCPDNESESGVSGTASERSSSGEVKRGNIGRDNRYDTSGSDGEITPTPASLRPLPPLPEDVGVESSSPPRRSMTETPKQFYRLSIPPSLKLSPSMASMASFRGRAPKRLDPSASLASLTPSVASVASFVDTWPRRTPSPVKKMRATLHSPRPEGRKRRSPEPEGTKRGPSIAVLKNVVSSALKRRGGSNRPAEPDSPDSPLLTTEERC